MAVFETFTAEIAADDDRLVNDKEVSARGALRGTQLMINKKLAIWHAVIHRMTGHFRKKRGMHLKSLYPNIHELKICDLGGSRHFWDKSALDIPRSNITIYNVSEDETANIKGRQNDSIQFFLYDGLHIPVDNNHYDLLICNSVLEHVPVDMRKQLCLEMRRVSKQFFCQTPAYSFLVDPHFILPAIHWIPKSKFGLCLVYLSPWYILSRPKREIVYSYYYETNLLTEKEVKLLFPGCTISYEKFMGFVKSFLITGSSI
jgi:hypothetical protein